MRGVVALYRISWRVTFFAYKMLDESRWEKSVKLFSFELLIEVFGKQSVCIRNESGPYAWNASSFGESSSEDV